MMDFETREKFNELNEKLDTVIALLKALLKALASHGDDRDTEEPQPTGE